MNPGNISSSPTRENGLRPSKSMTPITSIAELKKRVSNPKTRDWLCHGGCISEILDYIDELEASVRERIGELVIRDPFRQKPELRDELRKILGEGDR